MKLFELFLAGLIVAILAVLISQLLGCSSKLVTTDELIQLGWKYECNNSFHGSQCHWAPPKGI